MELRDFAAVCGDTNVAELVAARNYKLALKSVDKKLKKKSPKTLYLNVLRTGLLSKAGETDAALASWNSLRNSKDAIVDERVRASLLTIAVDLRSDGVQVDDKAVEGLYLDAVQSGTSVQSQASMIEEWMYLSIEAEQWAWVVRATQRLFGLFAKSSPQYRKYWLWHYLARYQSHLHLLHNTGTGSWLDQKITYSSLLKAAKFHETPESDKTRAPIPLETTQELTFFVNIALRDADSNTAVYPDLLDILTQTVVDSLIANDYQFSQVLSKAMAKAPSTQRIKHTKGVLRKAKRDNLECQVDDWLTWNNCVRSVLTDSIDVTTALLESEVNDAVKRMEDFQDFSHEILAQGFSVRNTDLVGELFLLKLHQSAVEEHSLPDPTSASLVNHFKSHSSQPYIVADMEKGLALLRNRSFALAEVKKWTEIIRPSEETSEASKEWSKWLRTEANRLQIHAWELKSRPQSPDLKPCLEGHVLACIELWNWSVKNQGLFLDNAYQAGLDVLTSACWATECLAAQGVDEKLRCATLLAYAGAHAISHLRLDSQLRALYLLQHAAASTEAWTLYKNMEVLKMLIEPMSPVMFVRISSRLPNTTLALDAYTTLVKPISHYQDTLSEINRSQEIALEKGNLTQCLDMTDLAHEHKGSLARWMLVLERRRIARLRGHRYDEMDVVHDPSQMPRLCDKTRKPWSSCPGGPLGAEYVQYLAALDQIAEYLRCDPAYEHEYMGRMSKRLEHVQLFDVEKYAGTLRRTEFVSLILHVQLGEALSLFNNKDAGGVQDTLKTVTAAIPKLVAEEKLGVESKEGHGMIVSDIVTVLECLNACTALTVKLAKRSQALPGTKQLLEGVKTASAEQMNRLRGIVQQHHSALKTGYTTADFLAEMGKNGAPWLQVGKDILQLVGETRVAELLKSMQHDATAAFDGVLKLHLVG